MKRSHLVLLVALVVASRLSASTIDAEKCDDLWMSITLESLAKASPADLHIYDPLGNHLGMNYETMVMDEDIPEGTMGVDPGGGQNATLGSLETGTYEIQMVGTEEGCYVLTIQGYRNQEIIYTETFEECIIVEETHASDVDVDVDDEDLDIDVEDPMAIPVGLAAVSGCNSIGLSWSDTRGAAGYKVYYDTDASGPEYSGSDANEGPSPIYVGDGASLQLSGLTSEITYYLAVTACDSLGAESNYSVELEAIPIPVDVSIMSSQVTFSPDFPFPGDSVMLEADVCCNIGSDPVDSVEVQFYDGDPDGAGVQIDGDQVAYDLVPGGCETVQLDWSFQDPAPHAIYVQLDPQDELWECIELNNKAYNTFIPTVPAVVDLVFSLHPDRKSDDNDYHSMSYPVFCYIELPEEYRPEDILLRTIFLSAIHGTIMPKHFPDILWGVGDYDEDGIPDMMVTFDNAEIVRIVEPDSFALTLTGKVGFDGSERCPPVREVPFQDICRPRIGKSRPLGYSSNFVSVPEATFLGVTQPNPFRLQTSICYAVSERSTVSLRIYDVTGRVIATLASGNLEPGYYIDYWNGKDQSGREVGAGVYFCKFSANSHIGSHEFSSVKNIILLP